MGGATKLRFGRGAMVDGRRALRTSHGHINESGVTSDHLRLIRNPWARARGTSMENAYSTPREGLRREGRMRSRLIRSTNKYPSGVRHGAEVGVAISGERCVEDGIISCESEKHNPLPIGRTA